MKVRHLLVFLLLLVAWTFVCQWYHAKRDEQVVKPDTVYVERVLEVHDTTPVIKDEKVIGHAAIPVHSCSLNTGKNHVKETGKSIHDTANIVKKDENLNMKFDIVQRKYTDDSTYTAYVSGLRHDIYPRLDSISVRQKMIERTIIRQERQRGMRVKIRPAFTGGYDIVHRQCGIMVGGAVILDW